MNRYNMHNHRVSLDFDIKPGTRVRISSRGFDHLRSQPEQVLSKPISWYFNKVGTVKSFNVHFDIKWDGLHESWPNLWLPEHIEKVFNE